MINNNLRTNTLNYCNNNICFAKNLNDASKLYENRKEENFVFAMCAFSAFYLAKFGYLKLIKKVVFEEDELAKYIAFSTIGPLFLIASNFIKGINNISNSIKGYTNTGNN